MKKSQEQANKTLQLKLKHFDKPLKEKVSKVKKEGTRVSKISVNRIKENTKRMSQTDYKNYQEVVFSIGHCQVCGTTHNLVAPHHAKFG